MIRYFIWMLLLGATERVWGQKCAKFLEKGQVALDGKDYDEAIRLFSLGKAVSDAAQCPALDSKLAAARRAKAALAEKPNPKPAPTKVEPSKPIASKPAKVAPPKPKSTAPTIEMVYVEGGTFQMGGNGYEIRTTTVNSFSIGKYEVTQVQWRLLMGNNPSHFKNCDNCPVETVSWDDVQSFIRKLNALTSKTYRLPTEAEWEYAARGGSNSKGYKCSGSNNEDLVGWHRYNSGDKVHTVGEKIGNELGIYDMTGNVEEWCSDWSSTQRGMAVKITGSYNSYRGGCFSTSVTTISSALNCPTKTKARYLGFRLVLSL
jgi:formylglycine-generating enzyme required for sulfatase activity